MTRRALIDRLFRAGIEDADTEARLLLTHFTGLSSAALLLSSDRDFDSPALLHAVERRIMREPLAYILGEAYFMDERYLVSPDCLIPRSDTERLVELASALLPEGAVFADLCTGSGCVAISLLCRRPDCRAVAYDISDAAIAIARKNAALNGVADRISFRTADLLALDGLDSSFAAILSNPPYICSDVVPTLSPEVMHEPRLALDGGDDGLIFYRHFLSRFPSFLASNGFFLFEIGFDQADALSALSEKAHFSCIIHKDYGENDRIAEIR